MKAYSPLPKDDLKEIVAQTEALWREAKGGSFFITGGTGFFGMWLLESFAEANDHLNLGISAVVLTRDVDAFSRKAPHLTVRNDMEFYQGDIRDFVFPQKKFAYVIHAATSVDPDLEPEEVLGVIVDGTKHLLEFVAQCECKKLLFISSGAVYGQQPETMKRLSEDYLGAPDPLLPKSAYGEGKRIAEQLIALHAQRFCYEAKIARCFAFVGPHLKIDGHFAIGNFIRDAMQGRSIYVSGAGSVWRSYLYVAELTEWLWTILFCGKTCRAYNVGSDKEFLLTDVAKIVQQTLAPQCPVRVAQSVPPGASSSRYVPEIQRAKTELDLVEKVPLTVALLKTRDWLQRHSIGK